MQKLSNHMRENLTERLSQLQGVIDQVSKRRHVQCHTGLEAYAKATDAYASLNGDIDARNTALVCFQT